MPRESLQSKQKRAAEVYQLLQEKYPDVGTFLDHESPFQLLIAVIMSAQCTDERINKVTPGLFGAYPDAHALAKADPEHVRDLIKSVSYFNAKTNNIIKTAQQLVRDHAGIVPGKLDELVKLSGVGRKTANVVLGQAFDIPGITVDTHVKRVSTRLGFTKKADPVKIEEDLMKVWDRSMWIDMSSTSILHGRHTCDARKPKCQDCFLSHLCPSKNTP